MAKPSTSPESRSARRRMAPEDRRQQILLGAIAFFSRHGFEATTRDLAAEIGITQPLMYRYFPTKEALIDSVYDEVFVRRWNPVWEEWLADRAQALDLRLKRYLNDYATFVLRSDWVRIFIYAGLSREGINQKYLARLRDRHFVLIAAELRHAYDIPEPRDAAELEEEIDLIWAMHSSVFYLGVRKWIYQLPTPRELERVIDMRVRAFLAGVPTVLGEERSVRRRKRAK